jgi:hypothetical protein
MSKNNLIWEKSVPTDGKRKLISDVDDDDINRFGDRKAPVVKHKTSSDSDPDSDSDSDSNFDSFLKV